MRNPDLKELALRIRTARTELKDYSTRGYDLDALLFIYNEQYTIDSFLNIENQIKYQENEIRSRTLSYLSAIQFIVGNFFKTEKFSDIHPVNSIWIFPVEINHSNIIEQHKFEDIFTQDNANLPGEELKPIKGNLDVFNAFYFFLGDPAKIDFKNVTESQLKRRILLALLDCLFSVNLPVKTKLKYLKKFHLTGTQTKKEVNLMQNYTTDADALWQGYFGLSYDDVEKMKNENQTLKEELKDRDSKWKALKEELKIRDNERTAYLNERKAFREELKNRDNTVETLTEEILQLKKQLEQLSGSN